MVSDGEQASKPQGISVVNKLGILLGVIVLAVSLAAAPMPLVVN